MEQFVVIGRDDGPFHLAEKALETLFTIAYLLYGQVWFVRFGRFLRDLPDHINKMASDDRAHTGVIDDLLARKHLFFPVYRRHVPE